jgi:hypothetical protein
MKRLSINKEEIEVLLKNSSFEESGIDIEDYLDVLLRNASFEEWGDDVEDYFDESNLPNIVLCSVQYIEKGMHTIQWFKDHGYHLYIQWLNPGFRDEEEYSDTLGFEKEFKAHGEFTKWSGKEKSERVATIRQFLYTWVFNVGKQVA